MPSAFLCVASLLHTPTALRPWVLGCHARLVSYPDLPSGSMATGTGKRFTRKFMTEPASMSPPRYQSGVWGLARARTSKRGPPPRRPRLDLLQTAETTFSAHTNYTGDQDCASVLVSSDQDHTRFRAPHGELYREGAKRDREGCVPRVMGEAERRAKGIFRRPHTRTRVHRSSSGGRLEHI